MNSISSKILLLFILYFQLTFSESRLLRFPTVGKDKIIFSYAGDLYSVEKNGGVARKLTNDIGYEMFPKISPDGKFVAFSAQYDGNTEVYTMDANGGIPTRLTYTPTLNRDDVSDRMGPNNIVMCWKNNSEIVFRSRMNSFNDWKGQLFIVNTNGNLPTQIPLPRGGFCSFSPDKKKLAYNRIFREFRTWKRYRGGQADDISIYDFETNKTEKITSENSQDIFPMWHQNKIYFISDRTNTMNLFSYDLNTKETKQLTFFTQYDIKFPSIGNDEIVFENGGYIYLFDLKKELEIKIEISINEDFDIGRNTLVDVSNQISSFEISPDGNRVVFGARGDVFSIPKKNGATRNLTLSSNSHERNSKWSPDGKWIAYISDMSGENEIYIQNQNGKEKPIQLTKNFDTYIFSLEWSFDSKKILFNDKKLRLQMVDIETKKVSTITTSEAWEITDFNFSPDNKWIVYAKPEVETMSKIYLYSIEEAKTFEITDGWYESSSPIFSEDGKYIFFVSERNFSPTYSQTEWNHAYFDMAKLYFVTLSKETKSPFAPKSDEVKTETKTEENKSDKENKKESKEIKSIKIDVDGIKNRNIEIPTSAGSYYNLAVAPNKIFYIRKTSSDSKSKAYFYDLEKQKETELGEINGFRISSDMKQMLVNNENNYSIIELPNSKIETKEKLILSEMKIHLDKHQEWKQIFNEAWRQMRDFFYDPNLHGNDWETIKKTYEPLVEFVNHRADLTYIIGEMIGELNIGHAYVGGGEMPKAERIKLGLLGAKLEKDESGFVKIKEILSGQNWEKNLRSPLTEIGVNAKVGDYIIAINDKPVNEVNNIYSLLINTNDKQVKLTLNSKPEFEGSRDVIVVPIDDEQKLYYFNWVQDNIAKVSKATDGKVGYIHIPDMGVNGLNQFVKYYYPQLRKDALIIDDRGNGGGNVSPMIIERLQREWVMVGKARNTAPTYDPSGMHVGPKIALIDEFSASDGDIFAYRFKFHKLGKVVGKRSWGGVVGIRGTLPFTDGSFLNRPEFSRYDKDGKEWIMEGYGVDPDIVVDNDPSKEFFGEDEQLNKAIEVVLDELKNSKHKIPEMPKYPKKNK